MGSALQILESYPFYIFPPTIFIHKAKISNGFASHRSRALSSTSALKDRIPLHLTPLHPPSSLQRAPQSHQPAN